jgi:hypothetical protein
MPKGGASWARMPGGVDSVMDLLLRRPCFRAARALNKRMLSWAVTSDVDGL